MRTPTTSGVGVRLRCGALALVAAIAGCTSPFTRDETPANTPAKSVAPVQPASAGPASPAAKSTTATRSAPTAAAPATSTPAASPPPASSPSSPQSTAAPASPPPTALQLQLAEGIRLYDIGEFYAAAGRLRNLPELNTASIDTQTTALKYLAFSYCVTNRRTMCQQQFEAALKLDPKFELTPAERGHPIWKVVFERAKTNVQKEPAATGNKKSTNARPVDGTKSTGKSTNPKAK